MIQPIMFRFHVNIICMFNQIPCEFRNNENWCRVVDNVHYTCTEIMNDQNDINEIYSNFCTELTNEMHDHLHYLSNKKGNGICRIKRKPFWNNNFTMLWKEMKNKEHIFIKQRGSTYEKHVQK